MCVCGKKFLKNFKKNFKKNKKFEKIVFSQHEFKFKSS